MWSPFACARLHLPELGRPRRRRRERGARAAGRRHAGRSRPRTWGTTSRWLVAVGRSSSAGEPSPGAYPRRPVVLHAAVPLLVGWSRRPCWLADSGDSPLIPPDSGTVPALATAASPRSVRAAPAAGRTGGVGQRHARTVLATLLALACRLGVVPRCCTERCACHGRACRLCRLAARAPAYRSASPLVLAALDPWRSAARRGRGRSPRRSLPSRCGRCGIAWREHPRPPRRPGPIACSPPSPHPALYVWRTLAPMALTPLDVIPLSRRQPGGDWDRARRAPAAHHRRLAVAMEHPGALVAWLAYLALLAPAVGLVPSGLQATADRYTYLPGIALVIATLGGLATAAARSPAMGRGVAAIGRVGRGRVGGGVAAGPRDWRDSVTLWTRVVTLDPRQRHRPLQSRRSLSTDGATAEAAADLREVLALVPAHGPRPAGSPRSSRAARARGGARRRGGRLQTRSTSTKRLSRRIRDRTRAQASRGMAFFQLGAARRGGG